MNVSVLFNQETFWLSQQRMAELFGVTNADISYHLIQIENNGELHLSDCIKKILIPSEQWDELGVTQSSSLLEYSAMARKRLLKTNVFLALKSLRVNESIL